MDHEQQRDQQDHPVLELAPDEHEGNREIHERGDNGEKEYELAFSETDFCKRLSFVIY